ncbi:MAG: DUF378 domain-containing protein [Firmicutes bacterium]|nr:DUF378 domain-containing protein [Bacillota bacterium]
MDWLSRVALALVIVGALNWLLVGLFQWDLITALFGGDTLRAASGLSRFIYSIIGLAGIYAITFFFREKAVAKER